MWSLFQRVETRHINRRLVSQESKVIVHRKAVGLFLACQL